MEIYFRLGPHNNSQACVCVSVYSMWMRAHCSKPTRNNNIARLWANLLSGIDSWPFLSSADVSGYMMYGDDRSSATPPPKPPLHPCPVIKQHHGHSWLGRSLLCMRGSRCAAPRANSMLPSPSVTACLHGDQLSGASLARPAPSMCPCWYETHGKKRWAYHW